MLKLLLILLLLSPLTAYAIDDQQSVELQKFISTWFQKNIGKITNLKTQMTDAKDDQLIQDLNAKLASMKLPQMNIDSDNFDINIFVGEAHGPQKIRLEIVDGERRYCLPCKKEDGVVRDWSIQDDKRKPSDFDGKFGPHIKCTIGLQRLQDDKEKVNSIDRKNFVSARFLPFAQVEKPEGFYIATDEEIRFYPVALPAGKHLSVATAGLAGGRRYVGTLKTGEAFALFAEWKWGADSYTIRNVQMKDSETTSFVDQGRENTDEKSIALLEKEVGRQFSRSLKHIQKTDMVEYEKSLRCQALNSCGEIKFTAENELAKQIANLTTQYNCNEQEFRSATRRGRPRIQLTPASYTSP